MTPMRSLNAAGIGAAERQACSGISGNCRFLTEAGPWMRRWGGVVGVAKAALKG